MMQINCFNVDVRFPECGCKIDSNQIFKENENLPKSSAKIKD